ncbi:recombinase family protein [Mucilaginibacter panaciglaebae]|uniref:Recombinase family protein n=1 Tax=Mucilaginibacter panaciglaebae TaxID=502331 RepID=A0ABP7WZV7_9SPHI
MNNLDIFKSLHANDVPKAKSPVLSQCAVIYTRVSTNKQAMNNHSLETQLIRCEEYCLQNHLSILKKFGATHESAKTDDRKEFGRMLEYIRNFNRKKSEYSVGYIVVFSLDRFSRTGAEVFPIVNELKHLGVKIVAVTNPTDSNTSHGKFMQQLGFILGELDNDQRKEKIVAGMKNMLLNGGWPTKSPLGYDKVHDPGNKYKKSVINEKGQLIKQAFRLKLDGYNNTYIQLWLKKRGLDLHRQKLTDIFKNPFYCGVNIHAVINNEPVIGNQEPMITQEEHFKIIGINSDFLKTHKTEDDHFPLKSTLVCGKCGRKFTAYHILKKKAKYYKCNTIGCKTNINTDKMHNLFKEHLDTFQVNPLLIAPLKQQLTYTFDSLNQSQKKEALELNKIIVKLRDELEVVEYRFATGKIEDELYQKVKNKLSAEIATLDKDFKKLNRSLSNLHYYIDVALKLCSNLSLLWSKGTLCIKQRLQNLLFPTGILFNKDLSNYRTYETNNLFNLITSLSDSILYGITGQINSKTDLSGLVAPTGIEPISKV